jgi:hypothetical protein
MLGISIALFDTLSLGLEYRIVPSLEPSEDNFRLPKQCYVIARLVLREYAGYTKDMRIVPVNFNKEHKAMLGHCKMILEQDPGKIAINRDKFDKLITSLRTAVDNDGTLDKEATSYNDIFDAFRLALKFYHFKDASDND